MIYLSASSIKDYLICPKRVFYRIHGGKEEYITTPEQKAGILVHNIIEKNTSMGEKKALSIATAEMNKQGLLSQKKRIIGCLENYFQLFGSTFIGPTKNELSFNFKYKGDVCLVGRIDRVFKENLYDWKTSSSIPSDLSMDIQFTMYYLAYKHIYKSEPKGMFYVSLPEPTIIEYVPKKAYITRFENEIIPYVANGIRNNIYPSIGIWNKSCFRCGNAVECLSGLGDR
jgi:CRISPR/Cas system-associated exonuclease Cas4 (RecB family)